MDVTVVGYESSAVGFRVSTLFFFGPKRHSVSKLSLGDSRNDVQPSVLREEGSCLE